MKLINILIFICVCTSIRAVEIPDCDYFDTVDLTYSEKLTNGSYKYEGALIPPEQTGTYNYKILFEGTKITVGDHLRGCVCKFKPCIRYCCHRHRLDLDDESKCTKEFNDYPAIITLKDGTKQIRSIRDQFVVQPGINIQCNKDIHLVFYIVNEDWKLFENGTLYRSNDKVYLSKRDYCLQPKEIVIDYRYNYVLLTSNCLNDNSLNYVTVTSILFVVLTTYVYIFVIKLQHVYDKCFLCYLICLLVSLLLTELVNSENFLLGFNCYFVAYLVYFLNISSYLWPAVMSFDFCRNFVANMFVTGQYNKQRRFCKYSLFVWGIASGLLLITILADIVLDNRNIDANWKVGSAYYGCYLKMIDWSNVLYLFGPLTLMLLINITFIIATIWRVHIEYQRNCRQLKEMGPHNIKNNMMFTFYLRILLIEILNWLTGLCHILYNIPMNTTNNLYSISIFFHLIYCILIFAITVTRKDVRQLISRR